VRRTLVQFGIPRVVIGDAVNAAGRQRGGAA
jgi:hypothetical protein